MKHPFTHTPNLEAFVDRIRQLAIDYKETSKLIFPFGWLKRREIREYALEVVALAVVHNITPGELWIESDGAFQEMDFRPEEIGIE